jgi:hypothetical protein
MTYNGETSIEHFYSNPRETAARHLGGQMMREVSPSIPKVSTESQPVQLDLLEAAKSIGSGVMGSLAELEPVIK